MDAFMTVLFRFTALVWRMRRHQNAWFRLHKQSDLFEAKKFERQVDDFLSRHLVLLNGEPVKMVWPAEDTTQEKLI